MNKIILAIFFACIGLLQPSLASAEDEAVAVAHKYAKQLKGIESHFVALTEVSEDITVRKVYLLMQHHGLPIPKIFEKYLGESLKRELYPYVVQSLDSKNGYMSMRCMDCETTEIYTYWKLPDGRVLLAQNNVGCGPICSDDLSFYTSTPGGFVRTDSANVMPDIKNKDFLKNEKNAGNLRPLALVHELPQKGTSIIISIQEGEDVDENLLKGDCLTLLWKKDRFVKGAVNFCRTNK